MREIYEFRIAESEAYRLFSPDEGVRLGFGVRKVNIEKSDKRFEQIGILRAALWNKDQPSLGNPFFFSWHVIRKYTNSELNVARLLSFEPLAYFEPCGEECGTRYDEGSACPRCGAGAKQVGPLFLKLNRIPKKPDITVSITGEIVVNQRFVDALNKEKVTGVSFYPVRQNQLKDIHLTAWYQFVVQNNSINIIPPTLTGINPFDEDVSNIYRCPCKDTIGLNILSEITVCKSMQEKFDIEGSLQYFGKRLGLIRPRRCIFASPRVRHIVDSYGLKGIRFEVVHLE